MTIQSIVQMLADGHSVLFIARHYRCYRATILLRLQLYAPSIPREGNDAQERKERAEMARVWLAVRDWGGETARRAA